VSDVNVFLGFIRPDSFLGGRMRLGLAEAKRVVEDLAGRMGKGVRWTAEGIIRVVNTNMALATKLISTERGYDPRNYTLVAFGGAGPLHAVYIAEELGIRTILVPRYPGLLSAYGLLLADFKRDYVISHFSRLDQTDLAVVKQLFDQLEKSAFEELQGYHFSKDFKQTVLRHYLDMRYKGQAYELTIPIEFSELEREGLDILKKRFNQSHMKKYGHADEKQVIEIVNYRLDLLVPQEKPIFRMDLKDATANCEKRSILRASRLPKSAAPSKSFTSAAK